MYKIMEISPLNLVLDEKNPRFKMDTKLSQEEIRKYLIDHEKIMSLADKMTKMNSVMPGERIIICEDNGKHVVLEGNRRTAIYQMFLNRSLIPEDYINQFPTPQKTFLEEIKTIYVDVVDDRESAMLYLAARHLEGVEIWSSMAKWRVSYEYFSQGKTISWIANHLVMPVGTIKDNIRKYKIILAVVKDSIWTAEERRKINPLSIEPDRLIRILGGETKHNLGIFYDVNFNIKSNKISQENLHNILLVLARKAFVDETLNTRAKYQDIYNDIEKYIIVDEENKEKEKNNDPGNSTNVKNGSSKKGERLKPNNTKSTGNTKNLPYFFDGLQFEHLSTENQNAHGIIRICNEVKLFSERKIVGPYPIAAAFLTRALIEHSLKYYAKTHNIQKLNQKIWERIITGRDENQIQLSQIIASYNKCLTDYIPDNSIREYFSNLFGKDGNVASPLNWVVHRPHEFYINSQKLIELPSEGLLAIINYLLDNTGQT